MNKDKIFPIDKSTDPNKNPMSFTFDHTKLLNALCIISNNDVSTDEKSELILEAKNIVKIRVNELFLLK